VAEYGVGSACEDGCGGAGDALLARVPDRVDAAVGADQLSARDSSLDLAPGEAERDQLLVCDVAMLLGREGGDFGVAWNIPHHIGGERS
jgi:hypothetical protein